MKIYTIDWGSYSAKIFDSELVNKKIIHQHVHELIFPNKNYESQNLKWDDQLDLIKEHIHKQFNSNSKILLSIPSELLSFRFKNLPIANVKKANAMLPFQIEDDIPFNLHDTYLTATLLKNNKTLDALCFFAKKDSYQKCLDLIIQKELPINYWIHQIDPLATFANESPFLNDIGSTCLLDIGHETTKAYFFYGRKFHSYQISHFGGSRIDEMMSTIYQLSHDQLNKFKHESAFIVPKELFSVSKLSEDQKFFAENMDTLFFSFVQEFKRWEMSFRVDTKEKVSQIYLIGGTSLIKNIDQYLSYYWERPVQILSNSSETFNKLKINKKKNANFIAADILAQAHRVTNKVANHLGRVSLAKAQDPLPLYSLSFVGLRSLILSSLCILLSVIYLVILSNKEKLLDAQLKTVTQSVELDFSSVEKVQIMTSPNIAIKKIEQKLKQAKNDIKRVNELNNINALSALKSIQTAALGTSCILSNYESHDNNSGHFEFTDCNKESSQKIGNVLAKQSSKFKILPNQENKLEGSF
jgi:general secretion pathway protein L